MSQANKASLANHCALFEDAVRRYFPYLFQEWGFVPIYRNERMHNDPHCLLIAQSALCRVKFYRGQGEANLMIGPLQAPLSWADSDQGVEYWYYLRGLLNFLAQAPVDIVELYRERPSFPTDEEQLAELSGMLEPRCDEVLKLFAPDQFGLWQHQYVQYEQLWQQQVDQQSQQLLKK
jgi:hypothetical protein